MIATIHKLQVYIDNEVILANRDPLTVAGVRLATATVIEAAIKDANVGVSFSKDARVLYDAVLGVAASHVHDVAVADFRAMEQ